MRLSFSGVLADAGTLLRANRDVLLALAGVFFFLPVLAFNLFVAMPDIEGLSDQTLLRAVMQWYAANGVWIALSAAAQFFGGAVILLLLLDSRRPTVGQAIAGVVPLIPALVIAALASGLLIGGGLLLFFVPGMYAYGRCYLLWAVIVAEREHGPIDGLVEGLRRTHGLGWRLFALGMMVVLPFYLLSQVLAGVMQAMEGAGALGSMASALCAAAFGTAAGLGQLLLQAAAYRALRQGI